MPWPGGFCEESPLYPLLSGAIRRSSHPTTAPSVIQGGDGRDLLEGRGTVIDDRGNDVSDAFKKGAQESLKLAEMAEARVAIMKDRSPSCGLLTPYCDTPSGTGIGVTAALFESNGIK